MVNKNFLLTLAFFSAFNFGAEKYAHAQSITTDTIPIEGVTIYQPKNKHAFIPGTKNLDFDSLIFREKMNRNLSELLAENSPIFIKTYGRGATATASFRGTGASHTLVMWNGLKINSPMSGEVDFAQIPLYFVDDVSIHFGQSSMSMASGGFGGALNLQSTPEWGKKYGAKIYQSIGSYQSYSTAAAISYGGSLLKAQTRVFRENSRNNFQYINTAKPDRPRETQQNADYQQMGLLQEVYYRPNERNVLSAKVWGQTNERGIPRLMSNYTGDEINRQNDSFLNFIVDWSLYHRGVKWNISTGGTVRELDYSYKKISAEGVPLPVVESNSSSLSFYNNAGVTASPYSWLETDITIEFNHYNVRSIERVLSSGYSGSQNHCVLRGAFTFKPLKRLDVSLLLVNEVFDRNYSPIIPSLSAEYRFLRNQNLSLKASVGRNFHNPSFNDLYWQPGGNPKLKAESGVTWETGLSFNGHNSWLSEKVEVTLFSAEIENWIMWLPHLKGYWEPMNLDFVKARGVEISASASPRMGELKLKFQGSYSYTRSSIENAGGVIRPESHGKQLPFIPVHSGGINANFGWRGYYFTYNFTYYSERFTTTSNNPNSFRRLYPYFMSSVSAGRDFYVFDKRCGLQVRVDNLLNESYQTILWRPMPGRNYSLLLRVEL